MAIRLVVTRGYGNGTYDGTIGEVVTRGYTIGEPIILYGTILFTGRARARHFSGRARRYHWPARSAART